MEVPELLRKVQTEKQQPILEKFSSFSDHHSADSDNPPGSDKDTPPKVFVCPITSYLFHDPVTLETGQTYERKAIQKWLERGNSSCPITRHKLHSTKLPKTNYVIKRLINTWQEENPHFTVQSKMPSTSPDSVISQTTINDMISELLHAIANLCMSQILKESEPAVLSIRQFWLAANMEVDIRAMLSKPSVINAFVEILFNSTNRQVLKATVFILSELGSREKVVIETIAKADSDVKGIITLFKKGMLEAVVLIYLIRPSTVTLIEMEIADFLLETIKKSPGNMLKLCIDPITASVILLGQILSSNDESSVSSMARNIVAANVIEDIVSSLESGLVEERIVAVRILLRCMREEGKCRHIIAKKSELSPVMKSFIGASDTDRFEIVLFLSELFKLNRRTFNEQVLRIIKDEITFSIMHTLLIYLQTASHEQCPAVAGLLLQLDLLAEPRKMSIYREEAIETLVSCLRNSDFPATQVAAAETIMSLQGRFTYSGKPLIRAFLLKRAGLVKIYKTIMRVEQHNDSSGDLEEILEEEKAAEEWERKMAFVLVSHEFGLIFEALADGMKSRYPELCTACFMSATWLVHMLSVLPDTGILGAARYYVLKDFISIFKFAKDTEHRALSMLALSSFTRDPEGIREITSNMKDILKGLKEFKKSSPLAFEMLKVLSEGNETGADMWNHKELAQVDCSVNGKVLSVVCSKDKIYSGHSDGTIKVWTGNGSILHLIQKTREHTKAVTSLEIVESEEKLYSGSLDRTARVWSIGIDGIHCAQVHEMKDQVHNLVLANGRISCFIPQGSGVKVQSWNGNSKLLNSTKSVKCLTVVHGKLYCGNHDNSIQEIDLATGVLSTIQNGSRKLLTKAYPIHALQMYDGFVYSANSPLDGTAVKIWNSSNHSMVGSLPSTSEVRAIVVSTELIYLGCKGGIIEIWGREKQNRVETLQTGTKGKVTCMAMDDDEEFLVIGTSDGQIRAWGVS